jgi:uncharacterized protein YrrD
MMDIRLGMHVRSSDDRHLGYVDRIILEPDTREVFGFIAHKGHVFTQDRVIETVFIDSIAQDTVRLRLTADKADKLPRFAEHEFIVPTPEELRTLPYPIDGGVSGAGATVLPLMWRSTYLGHGSHPASRSLLESAPVDAPPIEIRSNLPDDALLVGTGTDVISSDGRKLGRVKDVIYADGIFTDLVIHSGTIHHHEFSVSAEEIESVTPAHVRLRITAEEVHRDTVSPSAAVRGTSG